MIQILNADYVRLCACNDALRLLDAASWLDASACDTEELAQAKAFARAALADANNRSNPQ
jgi:hypothetical protein